MNKTFKIGLLILVAVILMLSNTIASEKFSYGSQWKRWDVDTRKAYIKGFLDGTFNAIEMTKHQDVTLPGDTSFCIDAPALYEYMAELYDNPENALIDYTTMLYLARDKLIGRVITQELVYTRSLVAENIGF